MFCPKCGSILVPKKEDNKKQIVCSCGYKTTDIGSATLRETIIKKEEKVEVIDKGKLQTLPKTKAKCPKCGKQEIIRCPTCRKIVAKYTCPECNFTGPN